jgi:hypothetical protein
MLFSTMENKLDRDRSRMRYHTMSDQILCYFILFEDTIFYPFALKA